LQKRKLNIIISGGGTGGHVFPAISIAHALKSIEPACDILFVGALGRLEMTKVPEAGFPIIGLPVSGFQRRVTWRHLVFPFKLIISLLKARSIIRNFQPAVVVGVGGYASGPVLRMAGSMRIPILIQEQNSYPGVTNRLLANRASRICVAYPGMEKYFPAERIRLTGNPVRRDLVNLEDKKPEARAYYSLDNDQKTILVLGGSLGAGSLNRTLSKKLDEIREKKVNVIWQTGRTGFEEAKKLLGLTPVPNLRLVEFIAKMDMAYAAADLVISRAGAGTISELCLTGKPCILVPSPNVAENHQEKNALSLVKHGAAIMVKDPDAERTLLDTAVDLLADENGLQRLTENIRKMAMPDADVLIAKEVLQLTEKK
jgi:UDP-N-acetylglucosamine--N-acetylmuramyl-(pentapeptide) pyrophosphoryl-undecaprenol N-acetylglucosamine transferase